MTRVERVFSAVARARENEIALISSRGRRTYGELAVEVARVARALREVGIASGHAVGVSLPRSIESTTAVLGVLEAGACYVPIDPAHPFERRRFIAEDAGVSAVIGEEGITLRPGAPVSADLLYILHTSGSTGRPKGVCGTHAATLNRLRWGWEAFPLVPADVIAHRTSLGFVDAAVELLAGLLAGTPTAIIHPEEQADLRRFAEVVAQLGVTRLTVVPSLLAALLRTGVPMRGVRHWVTSGEELSLPLLRRFREVHPAATLVNLYGTTEVTGDVTAFVLEPGAPIPEQVPIGTAIAGAELMVLDELGRPAAEGELLVGGPVLAAGYHRRPQEQALRFPRHPTKAGARAFRTGDRVRWAGGQLHWVGRTDHAVKIRGVRVEPEEIERRMLASSPALDAIVVTCVRKHLVAFVSPSSVDVRALAAVASRELPAAMLPARWIAVESIPLLPNGKHDRRALGDASEVAVDPGMQPASPAELRVAGLWSSLLGVTSIARDDTFAGLGGDSLAFAEVVVSLGVDAALLRTGTLADVARGLPAAHAPALALSPLAPTQEVVELLVEASHDPFLCAATELPARLTAAAALAYARSHQGFVIRHGGVLAGAGVVHPVPALEGIALPGGRVAQLDEWVLPRFSGLDLLGTSGVWPLARTWLAERLDHEVSVVWEDNLPMLAILRARGYRLLGRATWTSGPEGDGSSGPCEVWSFALRGEVTP